MERVVREKSLPFKHIYENIFLSSRLAAENSYDTVVSEQKISTILCLSDRPRFLRSKSINVVVFNAKKNTILQCNWILHFEEIHKTFADVSSSNGSLWIISNTKSIIKLLVASYIISKKQQSLHGAISLMNNLLKVPLNECLFIQLQLWAAMGGKIDEEFEPYKRYKKGTLNYDTKYTTGRVFLLTEDEKQGKLGAAQTQFKGIFKI